MIFKTLAASLWGVESIGDECRCRGCRSRPWCLSWSRSSVSPQRRSHTRTPEQKNNAAGGGSRFGGRWLLQAPSAPAPPGSLARGLAVGAGPVNAARLPSKATVQACRPLRHDAAAAIDLPPPPPFGQVCRPRSSRAFWLGSTLATSPQTCRAARWSRCPPPHGTAPPASRRESCVPPFVLLHRPGS